MDWDFPGKYIRRNSRHQYLWAHYSRKYDMYTYYYLEQGEQLR